MLIQQLNSGVRKLSYYLNHIEYKAHLYLLVMYFIIFLSDYTVVHEILYVNKNDFDHKLIFLSSDVLLLYYFLFPIFIGIILVNISKANFYISGFLSSFPFFIRYLLFLQNIHIYPFQKFNELSFKEFHHSGSVGSISLIVMFMFFLGALSFIIAQSIKQRIQRKQIFNFSKNLPYKRKQQ